MIPLTPKQQKRLDRLQKVTTGGNVAIVQQLAELEERLDEAIPTLENIVGRFKGDKGDSIKGDKGEDGYTPIKGVDYFDGVDGYTPIKGVDYFDGKDGRTPIYTGKQIPLNPQKGDIWYQDNNKSRLQIYNGKEWVEIAKDGKDAVVDYEYILSQIPVPKDGKDGFIDEATIGYLEDQIKKLEKKHGGYGQVVRKLRAGTGVTIDDSNMEYPIISASVEGAVGTLQQVTDTGSTTTNDIEITDTAKGVIIKSANGTRFRIGITNDGELTTTSL